MTPLLQTTKLSKSFSGNAVLTDVDFDLVEGEVHALLGENGAGKSTLIKLVNGLYRPDAGTMELAGQTYSPASPEAAVRLGVSTVHQEINLLPNLSVTENICLGREATTWSGINWRASKRRAELALARLNLSIDPNCLLGSLSVAERQLVAIARAIDVNCRVLILDEPTSSLDAKEVDSLFQVVRTLTSQGVAVVFVTHFLDQVDDIADRITVLRNGRKVGTWATGELTRLELVTHMVGRDLGELEGSRTAPPSGQETLLETNNISAAGKVHVVTVNLARGDVLGIAGLLGSGRTEFCELIYGLRQPDQGEWFLNSRRIRRTGPLTSVKSGVGFCVEDRKESGIFPNLSVAENIAITRQAKQGWWRPVRSRSTRQLAESWAERLNIVPRDPSRPIGLLSGGNQQKALLSRWLAIDPQLLILDEPTRGIDIGAKLDVMTTVESLRAKNTSFVFVSSELSEVVRASTSVLVLHNRHQVAHLAYDDVTEEKILPLIAGEEP